jgi:hypothetical protein
MAFPERRRRHLSGTVRVALPQRARSRPHPPPPSTRSGPTFRSIVAVPRCLVPCWRAPIPDGRIWSKITSGTARYASAPWAVLGRPDHTGLSDQVSKGETFPGDYRRSSVGFTQPGLALASLGAPEARGRLALLWPRSRNEVRFRGGEEDGRKPNSIRCPAIQG